MASDDHHAAKARKAAEAQPGVGERVGRLTITIPEAAHRLGIGRNQAYECAKRGEIPTIHLGKRKVVPLAALEAMLAIQSKQLLVAAELVRRLQRDSPATR